MTITKEQAEKIKENLLEQLSNFPEDKREQIKEQVKSMTPKQVENLVEENNLSHFKDNDKCLFCKIVEGEVSSFKIAEDKDNIAILEINPLSKGHSLVVPKEHSEKLPTTTEDFTKAVALKIKERFNPKDISINQKNFMGHFVIEIIPLYGDEKERRPALPEELKKIQEEIIKPKEEVVETKEEEIKEIPKVKPRIPN